jgi:hypothetical protein
MNLCEAAPRRRRKEIAVKVVYPRCAGIDIHKQSMTGVIVDRQDGSAPEYHKRKLATHRDGIRDLEACLKEHQVSDVGLESTGVYWKPVWNALEGNWGLHLDFRDFRDRRRFLRFQRQSPAPF